MDIEKLVQILEKKGFHAAYYQDVQQFRSKVLEVLEEDHTIGFGGSVTLEETGILDALCQTDKTLYSLALEKKKENGNIAGVPKLGLTADAYLSSTNALTLEGELINIDGRGNRVAALTYGPDKVIVVCGTNKIVPDYKAAIDRIKKEACPKNARRLGLNLPCAKTGKCFDCNQPDRICRTISIIQSPHPSREFYVFILEGNFGY